MLDDPFGNALRGPQSAFAQTRGRIVRFRPEVSVFVAHPPVLDEQDWADLAVLAAGRPVPLRDLRQPLPDDWELVDSFVLVQYSGEDSDTSASVGPDVVELNDDDVAEMIALVRLTRPGPFAPRTIDLGTYLGVRDDDGALIAMAGERLRLPGWTEVSAVCTAPSARGRGLGSTLIQAVGAGIRARGEQPFLHTSGDNPARKLYESLGFVLRSEVPMVVAKHR